MDFACSMGRVLGESAGDFVLSDEDLKTHALVVGPTGTGKSRFLLQWARYHLRSGRGYCQIDPAGDLTEDILASGFKQFIRTGDRRWITRFHFVEPGDYRMAVRWDPFRFDHAGIPIEYREAARRAWLHAEALRMGELVQLKQGGSDFAGMARLQRVLTGLLMAGGTALDPDGRHLPLADVLVLLDPSHKRYEEIFYLIAPRLDHNVLGDLRRIGSYKRVEDRMREVESTINRMRSLFSPMAEAMFSDGGTGEVLDVGRVIREGGVLLFHVRPGRYMSNDQKITMAQLAYHDVIGSMMAVPRRLRRPFTVCIDESGEVYNDEVDWSLGAMRKYGLQCVLAAPDLRSFRRADKDYTDRVLNQPQTLICFGGKHPTDLEIWARVLGQGGIDHTPLEHEVDRHAPPIFLRVTEHGRSVQIGSQWSDGRANGVTNTGSVALSHTDSEQESWQRSRARQSGRTVNDGWNEADGVANSTQTGQQRQRVNDVFESPGYANAYRVGDSTGVGRTDNRVRGRSGGEALTNSVTDNEGLGGGSGASDGTTVTGARAVQDSTQSTDGGSFAVSETVSEKLVMLPQVRVEKQKTGQLERSVNDQFEKIRTDIHRLRQRWGIALTKGLPNAIVFETHDVPDSFDSPEKQERAIECMKRELWATHGYYFTPSFDPNEQLRRLDELLANFREQESPDADAVTDDECDEPIEVDTVIA